MTPRTGHQQAAVLLALKRIAGVLLLSLFFTGCANAALGELTREGGLTTVRNGPVTYKTGDWTVIREYCASIGQSGPGCMRWTDVPLDLLIACPRGQEERCIPHEVCQYVDPGCANAALGELTQKGELTIIRDGPVTYITGHWAAILEYCASIGLPGPGCVRWKDVPLSLSIACPRGQEERCFPHEVRHYVDPGWQHLGVGYYW